MKTILSVLTAATLVATTLVPGTAEAAAKGTFGKKGGYNGIAIHMPLKKAKATGKLKSTSSPTSCVYTAFKKSPSLDVVISKKYGVALIEAPKKARTPRGIGVGSTIKQIKKAYPDFRLPRDGIPSARVPRYKGVRYGFLLTAKKTVRELILYSATQDCFG